MTETASRSPTALPDLSGILLTTAPMEGLTGAVWRRLHRKRFGGADAYGIPFVSPTRDPVLTERQLREVSPEANAGVPVIPQVLTRNAPDFIWCARALLRLGHREVNLNLGCPAGTVVAKGKGSGFLRMPVELDGFLADVFRALGDDAPVTVKTRLGWSDPAEFPNLLEIYGRHPVKRLIVHPRLKTDLYRGSARYGALSGMLGDLRVPLGINGDMVTPADVARRLAEFPQAREVMIGRGVIADPALLRKLRGGAAATRGEFFDFAEELLDGFCEAFGSVPNSVMRMKEYWFYMQNLLEAPERLMKAVFKARRPADYEAAVRILREEAPMRGQAHPGWWKPL